MSEPGPPEEPPEEPPNEPPVPATAAPVPKKPSVLKWQDSDWESAWEAESPESPQRSEEERDFEIAVQESQEVARKRSGRSLKSTTSAASFQSDGVSAPRLYKPPTWMRRLLTSKIFLMSNVCTILLNMIWTGFYVNSLVRQNEDSVEASSSSFNAFFVVESIFSGCFLAELIVRLAHFASLRLWHDPWLCFDIVVIVIPPMELWVLRPLGWESGSTTVTVVNIFRVFRVSRGVALLASINWFRPMYLAAVGFKHSINSLLVVAIYIGTFLFTTSLILCNLLGPSSPDHASFPDVVRGRFRSVGVGYLTLSECLLGGIEWGPELLDQLLRQEMVFAGLVLLGFLIVGSLLWLNTVAGIFMQQVDRSFEVTNVHQFKDPEFMAATKEILREFVLDLQDLDQDNSQSLNWRQISLVVTHHLELLSDLGIRMPEAKRIFSELDMNNTGYVSIPMFIQRLIENLKYKTLETLIFENQQSRLLSLMKKLARLNIRSSKHVMEQLKRMSSSIAQVESEEPLGAAVQRRLARKKQRVAFERDRFNEAMASNADLTKDQKSVSAASLMSAEGVHQDHDGHSFMIDSWKRAVEEQRRTIRAMVNPMVL